MNILRGFAYTKHGNMEYREIGQGDQVVVFLHPTPSSSAFYDELLPLLVSLFKEKLPSLSYKLFSENYQKLFHEKPR